MKRQPQNGEEEEEVKKKQQIWTERTQIRSVPPPRAPPELRKMKEEDDRLLESQRRRCDATSHQIHGRGTERKPTRKERCLAGHHHTTSADISRVCSTGEETEREAAARGWVAL
jgi:hypothetical protein